MGYVGKSDKLDGNNLREAFAHMTEPALRRVCVLGRAILRFKAVECLWAAHINAWGLSPSSTPSPVSLLLPSPLLADTDAVAALDKDDDAGYDPVIEADGVEQILWLSRHDRKARCGIVRDLS